MKASDVTAVIVTRGDVDLTMIAQSMPKDIARLVIWDNSREVVNLGVYGRYAALERAETNVCFVQDDDCLINVSAIIEAYEPGRIVANMPQSRWNDYPDSALLGWGSVFDKDLPPSAFHCFGSRASLLNEIDWRGAINVFRRTCDVIFSALTPRTVIDVGFAHLVWAETPDRMHKQSGHKQERDEILAECRKIRTWPDDDRRIPQ